MKEFVFPTMVTMKSGETHICSYHSNGYLEKKMLHGKHESYRYVLPLKNCVDWIRNRREKSSTNSKNVYLEQKETKVKNI